MAAVTSKISQLGTQPSNFAHPEIISDGLKTVIVVTNPMAGDGTRKAKVAQLVDALSHRGLQAELVTELDTLAQQLQAAQQRGDLRAVIAAGGDGTIAEIANRTEPGTPLAVFPLGTENLLAKYLETTQDIESLATAIAEGRTVTLDAGRAGGRLFLLMAGIGFDAEVVRQLHKARVGHIRHFSYVKPILNALRTYRYSELRVYCADQNGPWSEPVRCHWAFVFNIPRYGMGLKFAPRRTRLTAGWTYAPLSEAD